MSRSSSLPSIFRLDFNVKKCSNIWHSLRHSCKDVYRHGLYPLSSELIRATMSTVPWLTPSNAGAEHRHPISALGFDHKRTFQHVAIVCLKYCGVPCDLEDPSIIKEYHYPRQSALVVPRSKRIQHWALGIILNSSSDCVEHSHSLPLCISSIGASLHCYQYSLWVLGRSTLRPSPM